MSQLQFTKHCWLPAFFYLVFISKDVSVSSRASDKRDRVRNHRKPSVKHQEASWQKPWSDVAPYQGNPWRFLQAVQQKTGKSAAQWLLHLGEWPQTPKATISFFIQCRKPLTCQPVSFISLKCPWKSIILIYFLIYKSSRYRIAQLGVCVCVCV